MAMMIKTYAACICSRDAKTWLASSNAAHVLHVFNRSCNLINEQGEILSLVGIDVGIGPFTIVVDLDDGNPSEIDFTRWGRLDSHVSIQGEKIFLGRMAIDTVNAKVWNSRLDWKNIYQRRSWIMGQIAWLDHLLHENAPSESLFQIMGLLSSDQLGHNQTMNSVEGISDRLVTVTVEPARRLLQGIVQGDVQMCNRGAYQLAGLGYGLTPAGDDFILGVLYALRVIHTEKQAVKMAHSIAEVAAERTNPLSAAYLRTAALGKASLLWHELLGAIRSQNENDLSDVVKRIIEVGHTSGSDALTGFISTLKQVNQVGWTQVV